MEQPIVATKGRMVRQYKIGLGQTRIVFEYEVQFKKVLKIGADLFLVVEQINSVVPKQHEVSIVGHASQTYIHTKAKYIDTLVIGDSLVHFYAQHPGANEESPIADKQRVGGHNG